MNHDTKTVLVTAFFDISRERFKEKELRRGTNRYVSDFRFWASLKNELIIFTQARFAEDIRLIRADFGLEDITHIVVIENLYDLEPEIIKEMRMVQSRKSFNEFRVMPNAPSGIPEYSYMMFLKSFFLQEAVKRYGLSGEVGWIDFGFNHGGETYANPKDFAFEWRPKIQDDLIHVFALNDYDMMPWYRVVLTAKDYITGGIILLPASMAGEYHALLKKQLKSLLAVDLYDDDQTLLLMALTNHPELFFVHKCGWNEQFLLLSDQRFKMTADDRSPLKDRLRTMLIRFKKGKRRSKLIKAYIRHEKATLKKDLLR